MKPKRKPEHPIARLVRDSLHVSIGTVPVGDVEFAYCLAAPDDYSGHRRRNWFVGVAEDGIRYAGSLNVREAFVTPERAKQALAEIVQGEPTPARQAWRMAEETVFPNAWQGVPIAWDLGADLSRRGLGASLAAAREEFDAWLRELMQPVFVRMGPARMETLAAMAPSPAETHKADRGPEAEPFPTWAIRGNPDHVERAADFIRRNRWFGWAIATIRDPEDLAVDDATLLERMMERFGIAPAKARRMGPWHEIGGATVRLARALPIDLVPAAGDAASWEAFQTVADVLDAIGPEERRIRSLAAPSKARWVPYAERLIARFGDQGLEPDQVGGPLDFENPHGVLIVNAGDARHMIQGFATILPQGDTNHDAERLAEEAVIGDKGLAAFLETSERWHRHYEEPRLDVLEWDPFLPTWTDPKTGIEIVPLANSDELLEEGRKTEGGLHHCVGGLFYAQSCVRGDTRILSLRKDGQRLSTAEIDVSYYRGILQHRGHRNGLPPEECLGALRDYRKQPAFQEAMAQNAPKGPSTTGERIPFEIALEAWRPYLTGRWRTADPEEFYERLGVVPPSESGPTP